MNKTGLKIIFLSLNLFLILPNALAWVSIQLDPAYVPADGESTVTITATVIGPGNPSALPPIPPGPRAGDTISFAIEQGEGTINPAVTTTDINGQAFAVFKAGTKPEVVIIRATDTTVGQFAHGFVTAFKVEIKAPDRESAPPKFIALNGTSSYYAKTLPIPLAGDFKWSIIKKKNAEIQGSAASQSVTLKGITASKKAGDTGLKVMFKPTYAEDYVVDTLDVTVVGVEMIGFTSLTRGNNASYTATVTPTGLNPTFKWKFTGGGVTIEENTGSTNAWSGIMVVSGTIEGTVVFGSMEVKDTLDVIVNPRNWKMATPPAAQEVTAPAWDGIFGQGTASYQYDDEIQGNSGYASSGPNKGFYYILSDNYWENWQWFHWWITPGFRTSNGSFWVKTKQEEGYSDQQITNAIQGLIGHETDGTGSNTLGHRKIITTKIQGNPIYDPKRAVESLVIYNNPQQLRQGYTQTVNATKQNFENYYKNGEGHPTWGNWSGYVWFTTIQGEWVRNGRTW